MTRKRISGTILNLFGLLSILMLSINVEAQAPRKAQIAFVSGRDGDGEIYVMDTDGKNQRNLTNHQSDDQEPAWFDPTFSVTSAGRLLLTWSWLKRIER